MKLIIYVCTCVCVFADWHAMRVLDCRIANLATRRRSIRFHSILIGARRAFRVLTEEFAFELRNDMQMKTLASNSNKRKQLQQQQQRQQGKQGEQQRVNTRIVIFIIRVIYERALPLCHLAVTVNGRKQRGIKHFTRRINELPFLSSPTSLPACLPSLARLACHHSFLVLTSTPFSLAARQRDV